LQRRIAPLNRRARAASSRGDDDAGQRDGQAAEPSEQSVLDQGEIGAHASDLSIKVRGLAGQQRADRDAEAAFVQRRVGKGLFRFGFGHVGHVALAATPDDVAPHHGLNVLLAHAFDGLAHAAILRSVSARRST
jgi:hypothetical protein